MRKLLKLWLPVAAWAGLIYFFSSIPNLKSDFKEDYLLRKIAHVLEFMILTFLLFRAFRGSFNLPSLKLYLYPGFLAISYATLDELHQYFVSGRYCSSKDVLIDAAGVIGFYILFKLMKGFSHA